MEPPSSSTSPSSSSSALGGGLRDLYRLNNHQPWTLQQQSSTSVSGPSAGRPHPSSRGTLNSDGRSNRDGFTTRSSQPFPPMSSLIRSLVASALLQYTSTAIAMPWEVARTLLQVQWVPKRSEGLNDDENDLEESGNVEENAEETDHDEHESYFADPDVTPTLNAPRPNPINPQVLTPTETDEVVSHIILLPSHGVWPTIKRVTRQSTEGYLALWKGLLTSSITEVLASAIQPMIHGFIMPVPETFPYRHSQSSTLLPLTSHLITGFILSPLDLVRTRLIVQPLHPPPHVAQAIVTYTGPLNALYTIYKTEGGIRGLYTHPQLLIPTILDNALRPLVSLTFPYIILDYVGLGHVADDPENNRVLWGLAELGGSFLGLLVMLPVETVRRRLQVQLRRKEAHGIQESTVGACVQLQPQPYTGVMDCLWRIATEEQSDPFLQPRQRPRPASRRLPTNTRRPSTTQPMALRPQPPKKNDQLLPGLSQLYQGLTMRLGASVVVFILSVLGGGDGDSEGWAEL